MTQHSAASDILRLTFAGDVLFNRADPLAALGNVQGVLDEADLNFCNHEGLLTERSQRLPGRRFALRTSPKFGEAMAQAGFHVLSLAHNHAMDFGPEALLETIDLVRQKGLHPVGAGPNVKEARQPVIVERKGVRCGFLAYASAAPPAAFATEYSPGVAPARAATMYLPNYDRFLEHPGTPPFVITKAVSEDLQALEQDVVTLREKADLVVISFHWGVPGMPDIHDYQIEYAHAAIEAGADLVVGHHAHVLQGVEVYKSKGILYGLYQLVFDMSTAEALGVDPDYRTRGYTSPYHFGKRSKTGHSCETTIAKALWQSGKITRLSLVPLVIGEADAPFRARTEQEKQKVMAVMQELCRPLGTTLRWDGDEILIDGIGK